MDKMLAIALVQRHEHCVLTAYPDPVSGGDPWTIGWGSTGPGIERGVVWTQQQADARLEHDMGQIFAELQRLPWVNALCGTRQSVIADMAYNLGVHGVSQFRQTIGYMQGRDFWMAAYEMLDSKWARQVGFRAFEDAVIVATGQTPPWYLGDAV